MPDRLISAVTDEDLAAAINTALLDSGVDFLDNRDLTDVSIEHDGLNLVELASHLKRILIDASEPTS